MNIASDAEKQLSGAFVQVFTLSLKRAMNAPVASQNQTLTNIMKSETHYGLFWPPV